MQNKNYKKYHEWIQVFSGIAIDFLQVTISLFTLILSCTLLLSSLAFANDGELLLVKSALKNSLSNKVEKLDVEYDYINSEILASTPPSFVRVARVTPKLGTFKAKVYYVDNTSKEIIGKYRAFTEVPMVKRFIKKGEVIAHEDLASSQVDITRHEQNFINHEQAIGFQAQRDLQPGYSLRIHDLSRPTIIQENDNIIILYKSNNINVEASGQALKSGVLGENIKVKNERSGKIMSGVVISKGMVEVGRGNYEN